MTTGTYLIKEGYSNLRKHPGKTLSTMLIICATMLILGLFIIALVNTFVPSLILSFVVVFIYKIILRFLSKKTVTGRKKHIIVFLVSLIAPICYIIIMTRTFDFVNNTIFALQTGIIVTFVFWVTDLIKEKTSKKKSNQE